MDFFVIAILVFIVLGFRRGWRREVISLVFVLLAYFVINDNASNTVSQDLAWIPSIFLTITTHAPIPSTAPAAWPDFFNGVWWSLALFFGVIVLGYFIGDRVMPKVATPHEQFIGIIPAVLSGVFVALRLSQDNLSINLSTGVGGDLPLVILVVILAVVAALIASRVKKAPATPPKK